MALYIPHSIFHLARLLYVRTETFGLHYVLLYTMHAKEHICFPGVSVHFSKRLFNPCLLFPGPGFCDGSLWLKMCFSCSSELISLDFFFFQGVVILYNSYFSNNYKSSRWRALSYFLAICRWLPVLPEVVKLAMTSRELLVLRRFEGDVSIRSPFTFHYQLLPLLFQIATTLSHQITQTFSPFHPHPPSTEIFSSFHGSVITAVLRNMAFLAAFP